MPRSPFFAVESPPWSGIHFRPGRAAGSRTGRDQVGEDLGGFGEADRRKRVRFAMKGDEQKARDAGCDGYITKPIDTRALPGQVAAYLRAAQPQPAKAALKILVIEDSPSDLKLAQHVLLSAGHNVSGAEAVEEALQAVKRDKPQIILLDLLLPGTDGLVLARKLKSDPGTRDIPIVAATSFPEGFPQADVLAAGCNAYLVKPINTRHLPELLQDVVNGSALSRASDGTKK